jgi:hypothetical protein
LEDCQVLSSDPTSPPLSNLTHSPNLTLISTLNYKYTGKRFYQGLMLKLKKLKRAKKKKIVVPVVSSQSSSSVVIDNSNDTRGGTNLKGWSELMQFQHCIQWSLNHVFNTTVEEEEKSKNRVMLNPKDSTGHCKLSRDGLQVRNDTFLLESIRCTSNVESGVWYYEVLLLTQGVVQIGWGTSRCLFLPEEGCGVGDDTVRFLKFIVIYFFI